MFGGGGRVVFCRREARFQFALNGFEVTLSVLYIFSCFSRRTKKKERGKKEERERENIYINTHTHTHTIYIYIYIYRERERGRKSV